jgi:hypothetical protein
VGPNLVGKLGPNYGSKISTLPFDLATLHQRYETELRWQLGRPDREDLTMKLWTEMLAEK